MHKTFIRYYLILLCAELIVHLTCFNSINLGTILYEIIITISVSGFLTIISSLFNEKINTWIMRIIILLNVILFSSEIVYYKIYESFFSFNGI